ncbi:WD40 repeat-like protein [Acephala macrosclerotiorum]|nr:WD40 repeat-like protein [Acephala macrosclerotiorum]
MAGSARARPSKAHVVIELSSDDEDDSNRMPVTKRSNNSDGRSNILSSGGFTMSSNHGLPDPSEFRSKTNKTSAHNGAITSNRTISSRIPGAVYESDISLFASERNKYEKKFGFTNTGSEQRAKAVNTSKLQDTLRVHRAPILPGSAVRGDRISSKGGHVPLMYDGSVPSPIFSPNNHRGYHQSAAQGLSNGYSPSEGLQLSSTQNALISRAPSGSADSGLTQQDASANNLTSDQCGPRDEERSNITYSRILAQPSQMKRPRLTATDTQRRTQFNSPPTILHSRLTNNPSAPTLLNSATIITGESRRKYSGLPSSSADTTMKQLRQENPDNVKNMLDKQVIPHVKKVLSRYRDSLSKEDRDKIGLEVATQLMSENSFMQNMNENGGMLSAAHEQEVAKKLQAGIDNAAKYRIDLHSNAIEAEDVVMSDVQQNATGFNHASPTDAESPESEELFENSTQFQIHQGALLDPRIRDGSSPATSFSNGRAPSLSEDVYGIDHEYEQDEAAMKFGRSTRGAAKENYYSFTKPRTRRTRAQMSLGGSSSQPTKTSQVVKARKVGAAIPDPVIEVRAKLSVQAQQQLISRQIDLACQAKLGAMLRQREFQGRVPSQLRAGHTSYKVLATNFLEDSMSQQCQWSSQSGDAVTITWTSPDTFISGALTHYDCHNMQYNRYGNLVVGSTENKVVKMVDGHRTVRPIVAPEENKDNSLAAMRTTQDPWRYASVVSSAFCELTGYSFTASYDKTVKVWKVSPNGPSMELKGTWEHDAIVNFVVTSQHHDLVATACESPNNAVRVYQFDESDISLSAYDRYNASRGSDKPGDSRMSEKWAYHPATMQWGRAKQVSKLLLVGYSPRATAVHSDEIPEAKRNTGELCCWNADTGFQVPITGVVSKNVFEVVWHPTQPAFLVATAPVTGDSKSVKTQVRLFTLGGAADAESFTCLMTLDCPAADVNELTIMPAPTIEIGGYITASCTDGNTYVWDTKQGDEPIHVLPHGESIDNPDPNLPLEEADSGVKFAAWGQSSNRLYTGSSDGVVKVWDITRPVGQVFIRNVLEVQGGIACGVFSWDHTQLMLGDATGHLHLVRASEDDEFEEQKSDTHKSILRGNNDSKNDGTSEDETTQDENNEGKSNEYKSEEQKAVDFAKQQDTALAKAKVLALAKERDIILENNKAFAVMLSQRKLIIPHLEPPPPAHLVLPGILNTRSSSALINDGVLREYPIPGFPHTKKIGQGPNYDELGMYCLDLHVDEDASKPIRLDAILIPQWDGCTPFVSQEEMLEDTLEETLAMMVPGMFSRKRRVREENLDLDISQLFLSDRSKELRRDVDVSADCSPLLNLEEEGRDFVRDE